MTTATQLNPRELLSQLAHSNSSGCLEFDEGLISWKIYLQQGNLKYVYCSAQLLDQLKYHLRYLQFKQALAALKDLPSSYVKIQSYLQGKSSAKNQNLYSKVISWLLTEKHLEPSQGLELIEHINKDALHFCLWLDRGTSSWQNEQPIPFWLQEQLGYSSSLSLSECLDAEQTRLKQWQNCSAELLSVHQRPYFTSGWEHKPLPASGSLNYQALKELSQVIRGSTSIRQLSLLLKKDELYVAQILSPYIEDKIIYLRHAQSPLDKLPSIPRSKKTFHQSSLVDSFSNNENEPKIPGNATVKTWEIVCIDDSPTILKEIQRFLDRDRFKVTAIDDPVQAVPIIFRLKPDLILLDITMPRINGYKICGLLRSSDHCNQTPIIMVTGNTGLIDKARAKIAGANDYLTKPFTRQELMLVIEKYLK